MQTHNLGYPRIGSQRELKKACENYWAGKISRQELFQRGNEIKLANWTIQQDNGIDLIPSNDFSYYDHVLDMAFSLGAIPERYHPVILDKSNAEIDLYFAMARGYQDRGLDIKAMEMTKWFDTNYHYIVPEFHKGQTFKLFSTKIIQEYTEAKLAGFKTKPVILGPISFLLLGKEKEAGFDSIDLIENLLPVYFQILEKLIAHGVEWVQFDEPFLALDLKEKEKQAFLTTYSKIKKEFPHLKTLLATYFGSLEDNVSLALSLPVCCLHVDLVRGGDQLTEILTKKPQNLSLSLGIIDGRNVWKNDYHESLTLIQKVKSVVAKDQIFLAPSCSLLHSPCDLNSESTLDTSIKSWLAFAKQKLNELQDLKELAQDAVLNQLLTGSVEGELTSEIYDRNQRAIESRKNSSLIHHENVKQRLKEVKKSDFERNSEFSIRRSIQGKILNLPKYPTTTIGSFPQTTEVRKARADFKFGRITAEEYQSFIQEETKKTILAQEEIGLDVLVHGEFERNDMVEYFGERLRGFAFTSYGWVQSYGSRCVKPPIIYGDVSRPEPMTIYWTKYAQSLTDKFVKGMLTGPVTILQWSFVRDDQPRSQTCHQIALAIRDEVKDLEREGVKIIQIDEPALREGLPIRKEAWESYLSWAIGAFKLSASGVKDRTQIHTHMCYSEFNDIISHIANMDADVITIECSRSQMELLDAFADFNYPNEIGPGVYDIHSPRIPSKNEMVELLQKAALVIPDQQLWVNPDCGLKTRKWDETRKALEQMVLAAKEMRLHSKERAFTLNNISSN
ncbi:5-methyltetrahydropteroyltriglutamate--homocysteine S-methyltransferase [Belliella kenyensis]|uniref:5-methyltetrahydropteroyltriglutamate--homocysteine methyltransferase n=1 Tax=Belliella kenyensis TaxID=1472724 RepID=A0ABV8EJA2_9BACT|nr:5-methyltetrahydropteroyltriglutamate--homocysteine S-methyltransferase [Belliella kenyensis]MCH7400258.1 5-methyltetrahydropteroyltriglutamate--homocysteine S-methyltransferase [Belliella kenyensis]MDN3604725.1 5-methyltetrahydropteroyltriglutamate--homocysteine S-methyltransferase [Belliella kenyensis]